MEIIQNSAGGISTTKDGSASMSWRLIHDGDKVIKLFESSGVTYSPHTVFLAETEEECEIEIYSLGLN